MLIRRKCSICKCTSSSKIYGSSSWAFFKLHYNKSHESIVYSIEYDTHAERIDSSLLPVTPWRTFAVERLWTSHASPFSAIWITILSTPAISLPTATSRLFDGNYKPKPAFYSDLFGETERYLLLRYCYFIFYFFSKFILGFPLFFNVICYCLD